MLKFIHHLLNPHCAECRAEQRESKVCDSCETLKLEIERLRHENGKLLDRILDKPEVKREEIPDGLQAIMPRHMPWRAKQQQLERQDRMRAAELLKNLPKPDSMRDSLPTSEVTTGELTVEKIEQELGVVNAD